ncbi:MAG: DEAD/DEAH box helicase, partial [Thermoplasmatota archaeon]
MKFSELPLHENVQSALEAMGFEETTPVQAETIPHCMNGKDVLGQAQTGTGKTAAFGIPLVEAAIKGKRGLVLAPTRELAKQVQRELQAIGKGSPVEAVCLIGGAHFGEQVRALERHPRAILVATPGRIVDHLERGTLHVDDMHIFVLDEADEMLSMGFADELDKIVERLPAERQTLLFSATMTQQVERLAKK